ncbi:MAG: glycosyltransferase family 4 protein [Proteobacteria bacterium]|nr:glycosyltransferase family 4 protein [Pseudomonadota bacterium]
MTAVLHALAWPGELSGAPRSMEESILALRRAGVDARSWLAIGRRIAGSPVPDRFTALGIPHAVREADTFLAPAAVADLSRAVRALGRGAVLHTHGERALLWGRAAARLARVRHVHTNHGFVENDDRDSRRVAMARKLLASVDAVIAVHPAAAEGLPGAYVLPNCLDADRFVEGLGPRDRARRRLALTEHDRCFLFCGRLELEKGADLLATIQAALQTRSAAAKLFVAGSGSLAAGVEAMTDVRLLGPRDDAGEVLQAADVLLMPSRREGLPMVALEATAVGTPVVGFQVGGLADSGLATPVPEENVPALVQTALHLVRDATARKDALARAREALVQNHSPAAHAAALSRLYDA